MEPTPSNAEKSERSEQLDDRWYERFAAVGAFEDYEYLDGQKENRESEKERFISGEIENPTLDYPKLNKEALKESEKSLLELKDEILINESNEVVRQVYRWKLNEKIADVRLLGAALAASVADDPKEKAKHLRHFNRYNSFVHGSPSEDIFRYTVGRLRDLADSSLSSDNEVINKAGQAVIAALPEVESVDIPLPDDTTITNVQEQTEKEVGSLVHLPDEGKMNSEEIAQSFSQALAALGVEGWQVVKEENRTAINVSQESQMVKVPETRSLAAARMRQLIGHEIGTHVVRRVNGERSRLRLLGLGLDRYLPAEEGIATMREQALGRDTAEFTGESSHLAISLARGLDGQPRNFRQVFEILQSVAKLQNLELGLEEVEAEKKAAASAWTQCVRTFRGTDCQTPGVCYTKDIAYREGNIATWRLVGEQPEALVSFNIGKFDPTNERHLLVLSQLGITDSDLHGLAENSES